MAIIDLIVFIFDLVEDEDYQVDDCHLNFSWDIVPGLPEQLRVPDDKHGALRLIVAALLVAYERNKAVTYSRSKKCYVGKQRYSGSSFTYTHILKAVKILYEAGYIDNWIAPPCPPKKGQQGYQSTMSATQKLVEACSEVTIVPIHHECICLNNEFRKRVDYFDNWHTKLMREEIRSINSVMSAIDLNIDMDGVTRNGRYIIIPHITSRTNERKDILIPYVRPKVNRIFCRTDFRFGGRLYGPWQGIPKKYRMHVTIDGEPTVEPDFTSLHAKIAYTLSGYPLEHDEDMYATDDPADRGDFKLAFLIAINAQHPTRAVNAIAKHLSCSLKRAGELYDMIKERHWPIKHFIASDKGVEFQKIDSELALQVIKACHADGIQVLPVHDSFIVPKRHENRVNEHKDRVWSEFVSQQLVLT